MQIELTSTLTQEDENRLAPALLKALSGLLDMLPIAYMIRIETTDEQAAMQQLDDVRKKFPGQQPLIQMVDGRPQLATERTTQTPAQTTLSTLHVVAFDTDEGHLVNMSIPFWLLRMKSGPIRISAYSQGWDDRGVSFRVEDIEKHGPGIIADVTRPGEGRVILWAE